MHNLQLREDWIVDWTDIGEQEELLGHVNAERCDYLSARLAVIHGKADGEILMKAYLRGVQIARGNTSTDPREFRGEPS